MDKRKYTSLAYTEETVADGRFDTSRATIDRIVLHTTVGSAQAAINLFGSAPPPGKETSAHYMVKKDGGIIAFLEEYLTAYHCGNYAFNQRSIGIEHEDGGDYNGIRPDALYQSSAKLVADICKYYKIPCDKDHIFRHHDVPGASTACPDALDTDRIIREAQLITAPQPIQPVNTLPPELQHYSEKWKDIAISKGLDINSSQFADYQAIDALIASKIKPLEKENGELSEKIDEWIKAITAEGLDPQNFQSSLHELLAKKDDECKKKIQAIQDIPPKVITKTVEMPYQFNKAVYKVMDEFIKYIDKHGIKLPVSGDVRK